jgi:hypothetical protein
MSDNNFFIGSEYAELDSKLENSAISHPVFEQIHGAFPAIVFGDEGMGKTASALQLVKRCQALAELDSTELKVFPVFAPFEAGVVIRKWFVEKISQALIDFTADNPRRFLNASDAQKTAMGRLMLHYSKSVDALHLDLLRSPFDPSVGDLNQVLEYILKLRCTPADLLTKDEILNLIYLAYPDAFDQVYFLWDICSAAPREDVISGIKEIESLALPLARQKLFIKIFAPLTAKEPLGRLASFRRVNDLEWNESQLRELIETRIKMFDALWERGIDDPVKLVVSAAARSPRHTIRLLTALLDYVDKHLQEREKLNKAILDEVAATVQG